MARRGDHLAVIAGGDADILDKAFSRVFSGLVYNHVWEDPQVDIAALALQPHHRVAAIASAGCNLLAYLGAGLTSIDAVDINVAHMALTQLKLAALIALPSHEQFFDLFGRGDCESNVRAYDEAIRAHIDPVARAYWDGRTLAHGRRINIFARGFYRHGVLARFMSLVRVLARRTGRDISRLVEARDAGEQRILFDELVAPLFDYPIVRRLVRHPGSLFALGVPPRQYRALADQSEGDLTSLLRRRIEVLACEHAIADNYFAWQVFTGGYDVARRRAVPPYLRPDVHADLRARADRIRLHRALLTDFLRSRPCRSIHRFVLLDSQDWMTPAQIVELWQVIDRAAHPEDARVIFRTAGESLRLDRLLPEALRTRWTYCADESRRLHKADRASIYGGFHLYRRPTSEAPPGALELA